MPDNSVLSDPNSICSLGRVGLGITFFVAVSSCQVDSKCPRFRSGSVKKNIEGKSTILFKMEKLYI